MGCVPKFVLSAVASPDGGPMRAAMLGGKKRSGLVEQTTQQQTLKIAMVIPAFSYHYGALPQVFLVRERPKLQFMLAEQNDQVELKRTRLIRTLS